jgi:hypothetical protein
MKILVAVFLTLIIAATISALSIVSYTALTSDSGSTPQPDRVVAVLAKCQTAASGKTLDLTGSMCQGGDQVLGEGVIFNSRLQITVRTSEGSTYQIDVPFATSVAVGDTWPK